MKNKTSVKKETIILSAFLGVYVIVTQLLPKLPFLKHTPLSLWIQAIHYMVLGTAGLIAFRGSMREGLRQWKQAPVKNLLWLTGAWAADLILSNLAAIPLTIIYPDYVSVNDNSVAEAAAILPAPILLTAFGLLGPITEELVFRVIPVENGERIPVIIRILSASLLFMAIHMHEVTPQELLYNLGMFVTGILYSTALVKTKNPTVPMLIHVLNNAPALLLWLLVN